MDDARSEYYATQMKTLARIAAALERQNDLLESLRDWLPAVYEGELQIRARTVEGD